MRYELWDSESGNIVGCYDTEAAALRDVAVYVRQHGPEAAMSSGLLWEDAQGNGGLVAEGADLISRALATYPDEHAERLTA